MQSFHCLNVNGPASFDFEYKDLACVWKILDFKDMFGFHLIFSKDVRPHLIPWAVGGRK